MLNEVLRRWNDIPKEEMCLIGDTIFDVDGANEVGIPCIGVSFGFGDVKQMQEAGVVTICDHMNQIPQALERYF